jgi:hypothetical protein
MTKVASTVPSYFNPAPCKSPVRLFRLNGPIKAVEALPLLPVAPCRFRTDGGRNSTENLVVVGRGCSVVIGRRAQALYESKSALSRARSGALSSMNQVCTILLGLAEGEIGIRRRDLIRSRALYNCTHLVLPLIFGISSGGSVVRLLEINPH